MCMLWCTRQQAGLPWLKTLISSNMFLTHAEGSSTQIISPSGVKSFQFSAPHLRAITPLVSPLGSMFYLLRSRKSLILSLRSLSLGSQNISRTFIPLFPFYYFPLVCFPLPKTLKGSPPLKIVWAISLPTPARAPLIMKHQEKPANQNLPSIFTSPIEAGSFYLPADSTSKEGGRGTAWLKDCHSSRTPPKC